MQNCGSSGAEEGRNLFGDDENTHDDQHHREGSPQTILAQTLADMMAVLAASDGVFSRPIPAVRVISPNADGATGAKFLRP